MRTVDYDRTGGLFASPGWIPFLGPPLLCLGAHSTISDVRVPERSSTALLDDCRIISSPAVLNAMNDDGDALSIAVCETGRRSPLRPTAVARVPTTSEAWRGCLPALTYSGVSWGTCGVADRIVTAAWNGPFSTTGGCVRCAVP